MLSICILMWKHFLVKKRRIVNTVVQLASVIALLLLVYLVNRFIVASLRENLRFKMPNVTRKGLDEDGEAGSAPLRLLYAPRTNLTDALMAGAGARLDLPRRDHVPDETEEGYAPLSSREELWRFRQQMHRSDAIVLFKGDMIGSLPSNLEYAIRMKMDFDPGQQSGRLLRQEDKYRADISNRVFAHVQWAVDTSYLQLLTNTTINQTLNLAAPEKTELKLVDYVAPYLIMGAGGACTFSHVAVFLALVTSLLAEKNTGIQELLKLVGVPLPTIIISHFLNAIPVGLMYALAGAGLLKDGKMAIFINTSFSTLTTVLLLHHCAVIAMGIFLASIINTTQRQATIVFAAYAGLFGIALAVTGIPLFKTPSEKVLAGIPPHGGLWLFMVEAGRDERINAPASYVVMPIVVMTIHTIVFLLLGIFFFYMFPGSYGEGLTWNSIKKRFKKESPNMAVPTSDSERDPAFFEQLADRPVGIDIIKVSMAFPHHVALTNVSLSVLQGEITVLLGHNGAGKTTLMNIITGMLEPTAGDVVVNGLNTRKNLSKVRKQMGFCPQHNLYYADLSVAEHYQIFAMFKGVSCKDSKKAGDELLKKLNLSDKSKSLVGELSGGMKRRVQLACALAGGTSVLILDEPTSGLDVETRRELWDILLMLRGDRTVLLTTHFMEEADALGDRIAALHMGHIKCFASPMFLKKAIGSGYRLTLSTTHEVNEEALTALVRGPIPSAAVTDRMYKSITFNLPAQDSSKLPALFSAIEGARASLGIETMGVSQSTLDDVFLKLCTDIDVEEFDPSRSKSQEPQKEYQQLNFFLRYAWQFWVLLKRQAFYAWSKKVSFFILQVLLPLICMIMLAVKTSSNPQEIKNSSKPFSLGLDLYEDGPTKVMYDSEPTEYVPIMRSGYKRVDFANVAEFTQDMFGTDDFRVGIHINSTHATVMYSDVGPMAAPAAVNVLSNTLAARLAGNPRAVTTLVNNDPEQLYTFGLVPPKEKYTMYLFTLAVITMAMVQLSGNVAITSAEREAGTRHILQMGGCPLPLFWAATYVAHVGSSWLLVMLPVCILAPALDADATMTSDFIGALCLMVLLCLLASCAFNSIISMFRSEGSAANLTLILAVAFCFLGALDRFILGEAVAGDVWAVFLDMSFVLMPAHTAGAGALQLADVAIGNGWCANNRHLCPSFFVKEEIINETGCCKSEGPPQSYFIMDTTSAGGEMLFLFLQFVGYTVFLLILDSQILSAIFGSKANQAKSRFTDPAIATEKQYVEEQIKLSKHDITDAVLVYDIYKKYMSRGVPFLAVKGVSFSVKKGECFGLLGVNGAGKSTTFKMLNAEERPSHGNIFSAGYFYRRRYSYMNTFSYCGQFQGMDTFLTGRQNLDLALTMRGFQRRDVAQETLSWLGELGLMKYADRRISTYSGGCSRRLAAAAALCQRASTTLLDEPTAGVDPVARRCVQAAVVRAKRAKQSVIIASHSMDEMEALCERMVILSGGQVAALGSAPALRSKHAKGYAVTFKLYPVKAVGGGASAQSSEALDAELHRRFDCQLTDDRKVMLLYHINDLLPYSTLFTKMEEIKNTFPSLIEDYSVTETTLEEVFLTFAKEAIDHKEMLRQKKKTKKREPFFKKWFGKKQ